MNSKSRILEKGKNRKMLENLIEKISLEEIIRIILKRYPPTEIQLELNGALRTQAKWIVENGGEFDLRDKKVEFIVRCVNCGNFMEVEYEPVGEEKNKLISLRELKGAVKIHYDSHYHRQLKFAAEKEKYESPICCTNCGGTLFELVFLACPGYHY